jgi:hypothetical protein
MADDGPHTPAEYGSVGNVAREVVQQIAAWILGR